MPKPEGSKLKPSKCNKFHPTDVECFITLIPGFQHLNWTIQDLKEQEQKLSSQFGTIQ